MTEQRDEAYLQIGEAAERTDLTQRTLRYYEEKGLLKPPSRMDGGFRLYSGEDLERIESIKQLKDLLGFSLAEIKEMIEAEDVRTEIRAQWRADAGNDEKATKVESAREVTLRQIALIDQKMAKMASMRDVLAERLAKYNNWLREHQRETESASATR